jgi:SAM-dependent methyltransferase
MDFKLKCAMQHVCASAPGGRSLRYLLQRYVTRSLPLSDTDFEASRQRAERHLATYARATGRLPRSVLEFGCGWDLAIAVAMGMTGCAVIASDIEPLARTALVENTLARLGAESLSAANVSYRAPMDARATGLESSSLDLVTSTWVLEHIPAGNLAAILRECGRILAPDGLCSFYVDMSDHWSHGDAQISEVNFLRYSRFAWRLYNPATHYQNRLRYSDYVRMFGDAGFRVESDIATRYTGTLVAHPDFEQYDHDDLRITGAWFVLRKSDVATRTA